MNIAKDDLPTVQEIMARVPGLSRKSAQRRRSNVKYGHKPVEHLFQPYRYKCSQAKRPIVPNTKKWGDLGLGPRIPIESIPGPTPLEQRELS